MRRSTPRCSPRPHVKNDLIGKASTLTSRMKSGKSTRTYAYKPGISLEVGEKIQNPRKRSGHVFNDKKPVRIKLDDGTTEQYGVSCAAHHCIPAQESLKGSPLLEFMCKKGADAKLKDSSFSGGKIWSDVGYDTNGSENGIFLPGSYAVSAAWRGWGENDDDELPDDAGDIGSETSASKLSGALHQISADSPKWQYVKQAMSMAPGQFHDRHVDYSQFVQSVLGKIHANYVSLHATMIGDEKCGDCKKKKSDIEKLGAPTPFGLVDRLNRVSKQLAGWLRGTIWKKNIYTSKWCLAYMMSVKK